MGAVSTHRIASHLTTVLFTYACTDKQTHERYTRTHARTHARTHTHNIEGLVRRANLVKAVSQ